MSRQNVYTDEAAEADVRRAVSHVVGFFRMLGHKNEHAIEMAAQALDLTPRRAWALRYPSQLVKVARVQRDLILHRWWAQMDRQAAELRARADQIERTAEAERLATAQLQLPLGEPRCSGQSPHDSVCGDGCGPRRGVMNARSRGGGRGTGGCDAG